MREHRTPQTARPQEHKRSIPPEDGGVRELQGGAQEEGSDGVAAVDEAGFVEVVDVCEAEVEWGCED